MYRGTQGADAFPRAAASRRRSAQARQVDHRPSSGKPDGGREAQTPPRFTFDTIGLFLLSFKRHKTGSRWGERPASEVVPMRKTAAALIVMFAMVGMAAAEEADGTIQKVDPQTMTIVLDDGKTYRLPAEMDISALAEGVEVTIAYDVNGDVNQITDMVIQ